MNKIDNTEVEPLLISKKEARIITCLLCIAYTLDYLLGLNNTPYVQATGWIAGALIVGTVVTAGVGMYSANKAAEAADANNALSAQISAAQLAFQKEQQAALDAQKDVYRQFQFKNPYENMENVFEDLTVNLMQAQYETAQGQQMRADIMQSFRGAAGTSGIAGLAQMLANQGQLQTARTAAQIGAQEAGMQQMVAKGASAVDMAERGGEQLVQQMEADRQATLLGIQMGQTAGANAALQQAYANQIASGAATANMYGQQAAAMYGMAGSFASAAGTYAGAQAGK